MCNDEIRTPNPLNCLHIIFLSFRFLSSPPVTVQETDKIKIFGVEIYAQEPKFKK